MAKKIAVTNEGVNTTASNGINPLKIKHPIYKNNIDLWEKYRALYEGGFGIVDHDFIKKHEVESQNAFDRRKSRAFDYRNIPAIIISIYISNIFRQAPKREFLTGDKAEKALVEISKDVDRQGTSANSFFRKTEASAMVEGVVHVLIDLPRLPDEYKDMPRVKANKDALNIHPYAKTFKPQDVLDWGFEAEDPKTMGKLKWVKLRYPVVMERRGDSPAWQQEAKLTDAYLIYSTNKWEIYTEENNKEKLLYEGTHEFREVPLVSFYAQKIGTMLGRSLLHDIAPLVYAQYNKLSQRDEAELWASFPILFIMSKLENINTLGIGRNRAILLQQGDETKYEFVPAESVELLTKTIKELRQEIIALAIRQLSTFEADNGGQESSEQRAMSRADLTASMVDWATSFQKSESEFWRLMAKAESLKRTDFPVQYNQDYEYETIAEQIRSALNVRDLKVPSAKFNELYWMSQIEKLYPDLDDKTKKEIQAELEEYTKKTKDKIPGIADAEELVREAMSIIASLKQSQSGVGNG